MSTMAKPPRFVPPLAPPKPPSATDKPGAKPPETQPKPQPKNQPPEPKPQPKPNPDARFYYQSERDLVALTFRMRTGVEYTGVVINFAQWAVIVWTEAHGAIVLYKHAIDAVLEAFGDTQMAVDYNERNRDAINKTRRRLEVVGDLLG